MKKKLHFKLLIRCAHSDLKSFFFIWDKKIFPGKYEKHGVTKGKHGSFLHFGIL